MSSAHGSGQLLGAMNSTNKKDSETSTSGPVQTAIAHTVYSVSFGIRFTFSSCSGYILRNLGLETFEG